MMMRLARRHKTPQKDYIKIRPEAPGVRAKDLIPNFAIIGNCRADSVTGKEHLS